MTQKFSARLAVVGDVRDVSSGARSTRVCRVLPPAGPLVKATIEILSSDAGGLTFKLYQSTDDITAPNRRRSFDGLCSASMCP